MEENFFEQRLKKASAIRELIIFSLIFLFTIVIFTRLFFYQKPTSSGDMVFDLFFFIAFIAGCIFPLLEIKKEKTLFINIQVIIN